MALTEIEHKITTNKVPVGGVLIEPILGAKGVLFYRPEFLTKLRQVASFGPGTARESQWPSILRLARALEAESDKCLALLEHCMSYNL